MSFSSAGGRKVAGSNPVAPTTRKPALEAGFRRLGRSASPAGWSCGDRRHLRILVRQYDRRTTTRLKQSTAHRREGTAKRGRRYMRSQFESPLKIVGRGGAARGKLMWEAGEKESLVSVSISQKQHEVAGMATSPQKFKKPRKTWTLDIKPGYATGYTLPTRSGERCWHRLRDGEPGPGLLLEPGGGARASKERRPRSAFDR